MVEIGKTLSEKDLLGKKDAVHVAVVLVKCEHSVEPGQSVKFTDHEYNTVVMVSDVEERHGIVDPFINNSSWIGPNNYFYIFLDPKVVRKLTHDFVIEPSVEFSDITDDCEYRGC